MMLQSVLVQSLSACEGWVIVWNDIAPPTQEVGCAVVLGVWWNGTDVIVCLLRLCYVSGNDCDPLVDSH